MPAKWLAEFLAQDTLKATELATVNDPLEWRPQFADPTQETAWQQPQQQASPIHVLCLSSKISTTAMWGHYADAHQGIALAFSLPLGVHDDDSNTRHNLYPTARCYPIGRLKKGTTWLMKVTYTPTRPPMDPKDSAGTAHKLITSKGTDWAAESEYRILLGNNIKHKQDGTPVYIGMRKHLSGIILGTACPAETENEIRAQLKKHNLNIPVVRASLHLTDYRIIAPPIRRHKHARTRQLDTQLTHQLTTATATRRHKSAQVGTTCALYPAHSKKPRNMRFFYLRAKAHKMLHSQHLIQRDNHNILRLSSKKSAPYTTSLLTATGKCDKFHHVSGL